MMGEDRSGYRESVSWLLGRTRACSIVIVDSSYCEYALGGEGVR